MSRTTDRTIINLGLCSPNIDEALTLYGMVDRRGTPDLRIKLQKRSEFAL